MKLGSYPLLELVLLQEAPARSSRRFSFSSSILPETPIGGKVGQLSSIKAVVTTLSSCAEQSQVSFLLVDTSWEANRGEVGQLSPIRAGIVTGSSCAEQSQVFFLVNTSWDPKQSCRRFFSSSILLETPNRVELGSYPLLDLFLSQEAPARSIRRFLYLLVNTSWDPNRGWVGQHHHF